MAECQHPEVRPDHYERDGAYVCVVCGQEFVARDAHLAAVTDLVVETAATNAAMRECIDRLRDGWVPMEIRETAHPAVAEPGPGWYWLHFRKPTELMTPAQQAVMAR